eukprot:m51a1_g6478 hypothetical protein (274) ;mRNA; r:105210-107172
MDPSDKTIAPYVPATVLDGQRTVTVFGASGAQPGDALWQTSVALGSLLARKGYTLVNGGYMGTMEATALGAKQAGGRSYGVVVPKLFVERHRLHGANPNLTGVIGTDRPHVTASLAAVSVNGGYMGTMEATALGAKQAGGRSYGVVVPKLFVERHRLHGANPNLTGVIATTSLLERIDVLLHGAHDAIVVLPGSLGTLQEIVCAWTELKLAPMHSGPKPPKRVLAWENPWRKVIEGIADSLDFPQELSAMIEYVSGVDDVDRLMPGTTEDATA